MTVLDLISENPQIISLMIGLCMVTYIIGRSRCYGSFWHEWFHDIRFELKMWSIGKGRRLENGVKRILKHRRISLAIFIGFEVSLMVYFSRTLWTDHHTIQQAIVIGAVICLVMGICGWIIYRSEYIARKEKDLST